MPEQTQSGPWGNIDPPLWRAIGDLHDLTGRRARRLERIRIAAAGTLDDGFGPSREMIATRWLVRVAVPQVLAARGPLDPSARALVEDLRQVRLDSSRSVARAKSLVTEAQLVLPRASFPGGEKVDLYFGAGAKGAAEIAYQFDTRQSTPEYLIDHVESMRSLAALAIRPLAIPLPDTARSRRVRRGLIDSHLRMLRRAATL